MLQKGGIFKAFALSGRQTCCHGSQGDCPGLGASALSGRMGIGFCFFQGVRFALLPFQGVLTKAGAWDFRHARFTSLTLPFQAFHNGHTWR